MQRKSATSHADENESMFLTAQNVKISEEVS